MSCSTLRGPRVNSLAQTTGLYHDVLSENGTRVSTFQAHICCKRALPIIHKNLTPRFSSFQLDSRIMEGDQSGRQKSTDTAGGDQWASSFALMAFTHNLAVNQILLGRRELMLTFVCRLALERRGIRRSRGGTWMRAAGSYV